ncbi:MAG: ABC transporter permease subunit [Streptosporangiales bacterium]|nr:ABC transporter permease subunit [Streptosporangiales bacterium]
MQRELVRTLKSQVLTFLVLAVIIAAGWWLVTETDLVDTRTFPPLDEIIGAQTQLTDPAPATFLDHLAVTSVRVVASLVAGFLLGFGLGVLFWRLPVLGRALEPYLLAFYAVPLVVFYPFLLVLLGINSWPIIAISMVMCSVPVALNTWIGFREQKEIHRMVHLALQLPRLLRFRRIELPAALPQVFTGARVGAVYSLVGTIGMEFMVSSEGLGYAVRHQYETFHLPSMYLFLAATLALSFVVVTALLAVSAVSLRHHE